MYTWITFHSLIFNSSFSNFCPHNKPFHHQVNIHLFPTVTVHWIYFEIKSFNFSSTESSESATMGGIITLFLITAVFISTVMILKRIGYICLRNDFPKVLVCIFFFISTFIFHFDLRIFIIHLNIFIEETPFSQNIKVFYHSGFFTIPLNLYIAFSAFFSYFVHIWFSIIPVFPCY